MRHLVMLIIIFILMSSSSVSSAEPQDGFELEGMVINVVGDIGLKAGPKEYPATIGTWVRNGLTISVGKGESAVVLFTNGMLAKLGNGEFGVGYAKGSKCVLNPIKGFDSAITEVLWLSGRDGTEWYLDKEEALYKKIKGPTTYGTAKALSREQAAALNGDLKAAIDGFNYAYWKFFKRNLLTADGQAFVRALVYYKYEQFDKMIKELLPLYFKGTAPSNGVRELMALAYSKMGLHNEAKKFWNPPFRPPDKFEAMIKKMTE